jgi:hypothetical protein
MPGAVVQKIVIQNAISDLPVDQIETGLVAVARAPTGQASSNKD